MIEFDSIMSYDGAHPTECKVVWINPAHSINNLLLIAAPGTPGWSDQNQMSQWGKLPDDTIERIEFYNTLRKYKDYRFRWSRWQYVTLKHYQLEDLINELRWEVK